MRCKCASCRRAELALSSWCVVSGPDTREGAPAQEEHAGGDQHRDEERVRNQRVLNPGNEYSEQYGKRKVTDEFGVIVHPAMRAFMTASLFRLQSGTRQNAVYARRPRQLRRL